MTWACEELAAGVGAVKRRSASGSDWRAGTVADRAFAFRDLKNSEGHLQLRTGHVPTPTPSRERSQPADARGRFSAWDMSGVVRLMGRLLSVFRMHGNHQPRSIASFVSRTSRSRFIGRRQDSLAGHREREPSPGPLTQSRSPIGLERVTEGRVRVRFRGRRLSSAAGARPDSPRKRKPRARYPY